MPINTEFQRKVVQVIKTDKERTGFRRGFTWSKTYEYEITAECGHKRMKRGLTAHIPKTFSPCKQCEAGDPRVPVEGPLGMIDKSDNNVKNPIARALFENMTAKASPLFKKLGTR